MTLQITKAIVDDISGQIPKGLEFMYAIFSKRLLDSTKKYKIQVVPEGDNHKIEFCESDPNDSEVKIARTIAFLFFKISGIKVIIESPGVIMSEDFFIDVGIRPFELFPALVKLIRPSQIEMSYHAAESSVTIFNKISRRFLDAVDGLSPVLQTYPITCLQELECFLVASIYYNKGWKDSLPSHVACIQGIKDFHPDSIPSIKLSLPLDQEVEQSSDHKVEILDFQDPDEAMALACYVSDSLFFKPSKNQSYYVTKLRPNNAKMHYILRSSSDYDDISANLSLLKTAIGSGSGKLLIIPISFPCFDILELFRRYVSEKQKSNDPIPCILFCDTINIESDTINVERDWLTQLFQPFSAVFDFKIAQDYSDVYTKVHEIKWVRDCVE